VRIKPNSVASALSKLLTRRSCEQGCRETVGAYSRILLVSGLDMHAVYLPHVADSVHARTNVPVLVRTTNLKLNTAILVHAPPIVGLEERVAELGYGHAFATFHS